MARPPPPPSIRALAAPGGRYGVQDRVSGRRAHGESLPRLARAPHKRKGAVSGCARRIPPRRKARNFGVIATENGYKPYGLRPTGAMKPQHAVSFGPRISDEETPGGFRIPGPPLLDVHVRTARSLCAADRILAEQPRGRIEYRNNRRHRRPARYLCRLESEHGPRIVGHVLSPSSGRRPSKIPKITWRPSVP